MTKLTLGTSVLICAIASLWGCSKPEAPSAEAGASAAVAPASSAEPAKTAAKTATGDCDLLSQAEIEQAFGGALTVRGTSGRGERGGGCTVTLAQGEHSELVFQVGDRAVFEMRRDDARSQSGIPVEPIDIGVEAYLLNRAQVIAIDAEGRSISLGLTLLVFGGPMPIEADAVATGVRELAEKALARL
jgi:hypothetical protein